MAVGAVGMAAYAAMAAATVYSVYSTQQSGKQAQLNANAQSCLLYTSDAADE